MRRSVGLVLVGLGVLVLVLAPLLRWYAYPRLAVASDEVTERLSVGRDVTIFDQEAVLNGNGPAERTTDVLSLRKIVPDLDAGTDDTAVWDTSTTTVDAHVPGVDGEENVLSYIEERAAFDRHDARSVQGHDQYISTTGEDGDANPLDHSGHVFKLPFATEQRDYEFWDSQLRDTRPMVYDGTDERDGLTVYRFVQQIDPAAVDQMEVPGALFDQPGAVKADQMYSNTRTIWVEPETGSIIDAREERDSFLQYDGERGPAVLAGTLSYTDDQVADNVTEYSAIAQDLTRVRDTYPLIGVAGGAVLVLTGVLVARGRPGNRRRDSVAPAPESNAAVGDSAGVDDPVAPDDAVTSDEPADAEPVRPPEPVRKAESAEQRGDSREQAAGDQFDEFDEDGHSAGSTFRY